MRSSLIGSSRSGVGAPRASGLKKLRGSFIRSKFPFQSPPSWDGMDLAKLLLQIMPGVECEANGSRADLFGHGRYCKGILACLITLPQSCVSSTKNCAACARLLVMGSI